MDKKARYGFTAVAGVAALVISSAPVTFAQVTTTSPGKRSVYASVEGIPVPTGGLAEVLPENVIVRGKANHVLEVDVTVLGQYFQQLAFTPEVNGLIDVVRPNDWNAHGATCSWACSFTGTWWVDLDAAEAAHPGMFIGQPLKIDVWVGDYVGAPPPMSVSMRGRLVKK